MSVSPSKYNEILRLYDQKRLRLHHIKEEKQRNVYDKLPRIKEIDDTISSLSVDTAKALLLNQGASMDSFRNQLTALRTEKQELLASNFPAGYLDPVYDCPDCHDTGYIQNEKCHCLKTHIIDVLYEQSNLKEVLSKENFDTFNLSLYSRDITDNATGCNAYDNMKNALEVAKRFARDFDTTFTNLLIYGETGVGKSFLTNCIAKELMDNSHSVIYLSSIRLFDILADRTFKHKDFEEGTSSSFLDCDLLIIDDLGTELVNTFTASAFFNCINERFLAKKPIIISTNLSLGDIRATYSERIFSRLTSNYTLLKIFGDDLRYKNVLK
ncbi:MAG: ATP-binding protein [Clostridiales bacterium]|nr:ATP-binding protein [Clostridiales bacterium]